MIYVQDGDEEVVDRFFLIPHESCQAVAKAGPPGGHIFISP